MLVIPLYSCGFCGYSAIALMAYCGHGCHRSSRPRSARYRSLDGVGHRAACATLASILGAPGSALRAEPRDRAFAPDHREVEAHDVRGQEREGLHPARTTRTAPGRVGDCAGR